MDINEVGTQVQNLFSNVPGGFWLIFTVIVISGIIFFLPVMIASSRGLSGGQMIGVFLATIFGFWILGLILALVLPRSV
ncbi:hypothetical protein [Lactococcus petauri]|uniref:hypothetical protein n=1 Tax=Lactococcus petauri TaxID=1940789 RepID=UPI00255002E2|nr:hypothetical protein [Lactococcus petauri]